MMQWPSIAPREGNAAPEEVDPVIDGTPAAAEAPAGKGASAVPQETDALAAARTRRGRGTLALALSLAAHVAALASVGLYLDREGFEAGTDSISVEIVFEPEQEEASAPSAAGEGGDEAEETMGAAATVAPPVRAEDAARAEGPQTLAEKPEQPVPEEMAAEPDTVDGPASGAEADRLAEAPAAPVEAAPDRSAGETRPLPSAPDPATRPEPRAQEKPGDETVAGVEVLSAPSIEAMLAPIAPPQPPLLPEISLSEPPVPMPRPEPEAGKQPAGEGQSTRAPTKAAERPAVRVEGEGRKDGARPERRERRAERAAPPAARERDKTSPPAGGKDRERGQARAGAAPSSKATVGQMESYGSKVNGHVQRYKRYPAEAARAGMRGAVRVSISIAASGALAGARVTASSGHALLDSEALATLRRAAPYPKPPAGVPARFSLTLRYSR